MMYSESGMVGVSEGGGVGCSGGGFCGCSDGGGIGCSGCGVLASGSGCGERQEHVPEAELVWGIEGPKVMILMIRHSRVEMKV